MTDYLRRFGQWGFVAGAAEGIGAAFCEELAKNGMNVIMVDVKENEMESLANVLAVKYKVTIRQIVTDLGSNDATEKCMGAIKAVNCRLIIYNAAYSRVKPFLSNCHDELDIYLDVNTRTPLKLVHEFASWINSKKQQGGILLMSSLAGLWGTQLVAAYSGTKAFNLALAEALHHELKPFGIEVSAVCAGATATPGYLGTNPSYGFIRPEVMDPERVAYSAIKNIGKRAVIIPGFSNKITYFMLARILPRSLAARLINKTMARTYCIEH